MCMSHALDAHVEPSAGEHHPRCQGRDRESLPPQRRALRHSLHIGAWCLSSWFAPWPSLCQARSAPSRSRAIKRRSPSLSHVTGGGTSKIIRTKGGSSISRCMQICTIIHMNINGNLYICILIIHVDISMIHTDSTIHVCSRMFAR